MTIKLVITDIDGVWTDGGMYYDNQGNELKKFNTSDSAGVVFLRELQIPLAIISGEDTTSLRRRAEKLRIEHLYMGVRNKLYVAGELVKSLNLTLDEVAYIGDDINDLPLLKACGLSATPASAPDYVKKAVTWTLDKNGGEGAFREFVERILQENNLFQEALDSYIKRIRTYNG